MTLGGMIIMLVSVAIVTSLFAWCVYKVFTAPDDPSERMHGFEQETPDTDHPPRP